MWEPGANLPHALGIYLIDVFGNRELLFRDPVIGSTNACPLAPRPVPPVLPSTLPPDADDQGEILVANVYEGLDDAARDAIKEIRVIQIFPKTTPVGGTPPIGLALEENARAVLGSAPVEPDGSVHLTVPARKPLLFQLLDENGMAYQTMRSLTYLQPGEKISCIGCHENRRDAPLAGVPLAARRLPSRLVPKDYENEPFSYVRMVQPILDKHCVRCHGNAEPQGNLDLSGGPLKGYTASYWARCGDKVRGPEQNPKRRRPPSYPLRHANQVRSPRRAYQYGAAAATIALLRDGHEKYPRTRRIPTTCKWIDCAIFCSAYLPEEQEGCCRRRLPMPALQWGCQGTK